MAKYHAGTGHGALSGDWIDQTPIHRRHWSRRQIPNLMRSGLS